MTLDVSHLPAHKHTAHCNSAAGNSNDPVGNVWAKDAGTASAAYQNTGADKTMNLTAIGEAGGDRPHDNMQPFQVVNYIIALEGIFPSRS